METAEVKESVPLTPDVETLEEEFTSIAAELKEAKARDSAGEGMSSDSIPVSTRLCGSEIDHFLISISF